MRDNVHELYPDRPPIGQYIRVGTTGHVQLETLLESGRLPLDRAVIDAAMVPLQSSLIKALRERGRELLLETNVAELSSLGRFDGTARKAPWAVAGRPLSLADLEGSLGDERLLKIASCAVENGFHAVLSPSHVLTSAADSALQTDRRVCARLRSILDSIGGRTIALDYELLIPNQLLRDDRQRAQLIAALRDLPFENLWIRTSGFGADATPIKIRRYIAAIRDFIAVGRPVVADGVAGLAGLATVAFGAAGALAYGVGVLERFDATSWNRAPQDRKSGGQTTRALVPALDRQLTIKQLDAITAASGGRALISCNDSRCCKRGLDDTLKDPKGHFLWQRRCQVDAISRVSESRRAEHFITKDLTQAERYSRMLSRLRINDVPTRDLIMRESDRLFKLHQVLENFHLNDDVAERAKTPQIRRPEPTRFARSNR